MIPKKIFQWIRYLKYAVYGALLLAFLSIFQKVILGGWHLAFQPKGFIVPVLFGSFAGFVIAWLMDTRQKAFEMSIEAEREANKQMNKLLHIQQDRLVEMQAFEYSASNALKVPLRTIESFSEFCEDFVKSGNKEEAEKGLNRIRQGAAEMRQILEGLHRFAEVTLVDLKLEKVPVGILFHSITTNLSKEHQVNKVEIEVDKDLYCFADNGLMQTLLAILADNAIKFSRDKDVAKIMFGREFIDGEQVYFVKDNGIGFEQWREDKIFRPFHSFHTDVTFEGIGMGLSTAKRIVETHGGRIWAESSPDAGATFFFTLCAEEIEEG